MRALTVLILTFTTVFGFRVIPKPEPAIHITHGIRPGVLPEPGLGVGPLPEPEHGIGAGVVPEPGLGLGAGVLPEPGLGVGPLPEPEFGVGAGVLPEPGLGVGPLPEPEHGIGAGAIAEPGHGIGAGIPEPELGPGGIGGSRGINRIGGRSGRGRGISRTLRRLISRLGQFNPLAVRRVMMALGLGGASNRRTRVRNCWQCPRQTVCDYVDRWTSYCVPRGGINGGFNGGLNDVLGGSIIDGRLGGGVGGSGHIHGPGGHVHGLNGQVSGHTGLDGHVHGPAGHDGLGGHADGLGGHVHGQGGHVHGLNGRVRGINGLDGHVHGPGGHVNGLGGGRTGGLSGGSPSFGRSGNVGVESQICHLNPDPGHCQSNMYTRYYYDEQLGGCHRFSYSGCGGNSNRFTTLRQCRRTCGGGTRGRNVPHG